MQLPAETPRNAALMENHMELEIGCGSAERCDLTMTFQGHSRSNSISDLALDLVASNKP